MKRLPRLFLLAPVLSACGLAGGPAPSAPALSAGELLSAPTSLSLSGLKLRAEAHPLLSSCPGNGCTNFVVPVKLRAATAPYNLPALTATGVYVVTEGGVWRSGVAGRDSRRCNELNCWQLTGRGNAALSGGDAVQVIVTFKDSAGRTYKLRDEKALVATLP